MFGWLSRASARASRTNRSAKAGSRPTPGGRILTATRRSSRAAAPCRPRPCRRGRAVRGSRAAERVARGRWNAPPRRRRRTSGRHRRGLILHRQARARAPPRRAPAPAGTPGRVPAPPSAVTDVPHRLQNAASDMVNLPSLQRGPRDVSVQRPSARCLKQSGRNHTPRNGAVTCGKAEIDAAANRSSHPCAG